MRAVPLPRRAALLVAAALVAVTAPSAWSSSGVSPGAAPERVVAYEVRTRGAVQADVGVFARIAQSTFNDRRGWSLGGALRYRQVDAGGAFTLWLASPEEVDRFAPVCDSAWSCQVGRDVVINDERWRRGTSTWPDVREYRAYVLNHELGHWLGLAHRGCSGAGRPAAVMQQQSIRLSGCTASTWPLEDERVEAARRAGVGLRSARPELYAVQQQGRTGTELHALDGGTAYRTFSLHSSTALAGTSPAGWAFSVADVDRDGVDDLVGVQREGPSGRTELHVLDGARRYEEVLLHTATALGPSPSEGWSFDVADADGDGALDLVALAHRGASGSTEVHVLDGAAGFQRFLSHTATPLHATDPAGWVLATGDHDRDGWPDVYAVARRGGSGRTEVHVLDGESGYGRWLAHASTPLAPAGPDARALVVADVQGDGGTTLVAVDRAGASGRTEVHALDDGSYGGFVLHTATGLGPTGEPAWRFDLD